MQIHLQLKIDLNACFPELFINTDLGFQDFKHLKSGMVFCLWFIEPTLI